MSFFLGSRRFSATSPSPPRNTKMSGFTNREEKSVAEEEEEEGKLRCVKDLVFLDDLEN